MTSLQQLRSMRDLSGGEALPLVALMSFKPAPPWSKGPFKNTPIKLPMFSSFLSDQAHILHDKQTRARKEDALPLIAYPAIAFVVLGAVHVATYAIQSIAHIHAAMNMGIAP